MFLLPKKFKGRSSMRWLVASLVFLLFFLPISMGYLVAQTAVPQEGVAPSQIPAKPEVPNALPKTDASTAVTPQLPEESPLTDLEQEAPEAAAAVSGSAKKPSPIKKAPSSTSEETKVGADSVPAGQELVNIDFPEPTEIKDIVKAVSIWTGKNVILGREVTGKVQMISPKKVTKEEAYQAFLSALNMLGLTTVETGKVIKIMPNRNAVKGNLKTFLGSNWTPLTDELITQIIPLRYIDAKEIQNTLSKLVTTNALVVYPPTNTLIISDSGYKVRRILDIIELLDVQGQQPQLAMVPIRYADAKDVKDKVEEIFKAGSASKTAGRGGLSTYKLIADERTNSVIIFGPPRTIADVKALVKRFDMRIDDPTRQAQIHVRPLDYADAKKLASTLSSLAEGSKRGSSASRRPPLGGAGIPGSPVESSAAVAQMGDDVRITADESLNALLITGSRASYEGINSLVRKLDIRRSQVFVEAEIMDINVDGGFSFGTSIFGGFGKENGSKTAVTWQAGQIGGLIASQVDGAKDAASVGNAVGTFKEDMNIGILSGTTVNVPGIGKISPGALIKMVKTDGSTKALASPHILTANNEVAKIVVGDKVYFKNQDTSGVTGTVVNKVEHVDADLSLEIKPNISYSNYVTLKIDITADSIQGDSTAQLPIVNKRKMNQLVTVKNGQTVVISGLTRASELETFKKIPLLGDLPILGWLFRNSEIKKRKSNLVVFLTPHIVHGAEDMAAIYQAKVRERDEFLKKMYGSRGLEDSFYASLPKKEDGEFKEDELDKTDRERREALLKQMRQEIEPTNKENAAKDAASSEQNSANSMEDTPVPLPSTGADDGGGGGFGGGGGIIPGGGMPPKIGGGMDSDPILDGGGGDDMPAPPPPEPSGDFDGGGE